MSIPDLDLVVRNARVATASDTFDSDIGIRGGRVVQLGLDLPEGRREIDAAGRLFATSRSSVRSVSGSTSLNSKFTERSRCRSATTSMPEAA